MSGVFVGSGLGLFGSSLSELGSAFHRNELGQGGLSGQVNVRNGNLVLTQNDAILIGMGVNANALKTYNSQGQMTDDNGDNWQMGIARLTNITASSMTRVSETGTETTYSWNAAQNAYVSTAGSGAHDSVKKLSNGQYEWLLDGDKGLVERFNASGKLIQKRDRDGNATTYSYTGSGFISTITTSGQTLRFSYSGDKITNIRAETFSENSTSSALNSTLVHYTYDSLGRLQKATVDLSPENNSLSDGNVYETTYGYDGNSKRIASVTQSDGTQNSFSYVLDNGVYKVRTVTYGNSERFTYSYGASNTNGLYTTVENALGKTWRYYHNTEGQLTRFESPAINGQRLVTKYGYDTDGNLTSVTDHDGRTTTYEYDTRGNRTLERDPLGNTIQSEYNSNNQRITQTQYITPDPDGAGPQQAGEPLTSRWVYDSEGHVRFVLNPEGGVTEFRYQTNGLLSRQMSYTNDVYNISGLTESQVPSLSQMTSWVNTASKSQSQLTEYAYDFRGQLLSSSVYASVNSSGNGTGSVAKTSYVYDYMGRLLETVSAKGNATPTANDFRTQFEYDGLGRLISTTDSLGNVSSTQYNDAQQKIITESVSGKYTTSVYDASGRVISVSESTSETDDDNLGKSFFYYDDAGQLRATKGKDGAISYLFYDESGRLEAEVDGSGSVVEYYYTRMNQLHRTTAFANEVNTSGWLNADGTVAYDRLSQIKPATSADDRNLQVLIYDAAGRVSFSSQGGYFNIHSYDGADRLIKTNTAGRETRYFYDDAGRQIGKLDSRGALTENRYNAAGQLTQTIAYATFTDESDRANGSFSDLRPNFDNTNDQHTYFYYNDRGELIGQLNAEGYLTSMSYDLDGNLTQQTQHYNRTSHSGLFDAYTSPASSNKDRTMTYQYNALGQVTQETNYEGTTTRYYYDNAGRLTQTDVGSGYNLRRSYQSYDEQGQLTHSVNHAGSYSLGNDASDSAIQAKAETHGTRFIYDSNGRVTKSINANGAETIYFYDIDGNPAITIDAEGGVQQSIYNAFGEIKTTIEYVNKLSGVNTLSGGLLNADILSALADLKDDQQDIRTDFSYNVRGQVRQIMQQVLKASGELASYRTNHTYNGFGEIEKTEQDIDFNGHVKQTEFTYDASGNLKSSTLTTSASTTQTQTFQYDAFGRRINLIDAKDNVTEQSYDRLGRLIEITRADNGVLKTTFDAFSQVLSQTDALGNITSYRYDDANKTHTIISPDGASVITTHNEHGETVTVRDANGNETSYWYDANGNLSNTEDSYNETLAVFDQAGQLLYGEDERGFTTSYEYDEVGRVLTKISDLNGLDITTSYSYDGQGRVLTVTDPRGTVTRTFYDKRGQVKEVIQDEGGLNIKTRFEYDGLGNQTRVIEAADTASEKVTEYIYDLAGRRTKTVVDPNGLAITTEYVYDDNNNVIQSIDANGNITAFEYDENDRLTTTIKDVGGLNITTRTVYNLNGQVDSQFNAEGIETRFEYDDDGMLATQIEDYRGLNRTTSFEYDANNNRIRSYDANGVKTRYFYDGLNRLERTVRDEGGQNISTYLYYDEASNVIRSQDGNGNVTHFTYDNANRLSYTVNAKNYVTQNVYDAAGNILEIRQYQQAVASRTQWSEYSLERAIEGASVANLSESFTTLSSSAFDFSAVGNSSQNTITHQNGSLVFSKVSSNSEQEYSISRTAGHQLADNVTTRFELSATSLLNSTAFTAQISNESGSFFHGIEILKIDGPREDDDIIIIDPIGDDDTDPDDDDIPSPIIPPIGTPIISPTGIQTDLLSKNISGTSQLGSSLGSSIGPSTMIKLISSEGEVPTLSFALSNGGTVVVEIETNGEGSTLYLYTKGTDRESGTSYSISADSIDVGTVTFEASTKLTLGIVSGEPSEVTLDNYSETTQPISYTEQHYAYDALGRNTYSANAEGFVTKQTYNAQSQIIKTQRFDKAINVAGVVSERDFDMALRSVWMQDFSENVTPLKGALTSEFISHENGQLKLTNGYQETKEWPSLYTDKQVYKAGIGYRTEVTTGRTVDDNYLMVNIDNAKGWGDEASRHHGAYFRLGKVVGYRKEGTTYTGSKLGMMDPDTTYVIEFETQAEKTLLFVYEKGTTRKQGWSQEFEVTGWNEIRFQVQTYARPSNNEREFFIDNMSEYRINNTLPDASETNYVYDAAGRLAFTKDANGNLTENRYDDNGNLLQSIRHTGFSGADLSLDNTVYTNFNTPDNHGAWEVYDNTPAGAKFQTVYDIEKDTYVMQTQGAGTKNGYRFWNETAYNNMSQGKLTHMRWDMKFDESFTVYISVQTDQGHRYLTYNPGTNPPRLNESYSHHDLGSQVTNGEWLTFSRDLEADLKLLEPNIELLHVEALLIRGSGRIGEVSLADNAQSTLERYQTLVDANQVNVSEQVKVQYIYDGLNRVKYTIDAEKFVTETIYDDVGRVIETRRYEDSLGEIDGALTESTVANALGNIVENFTTKSELNFSMQYVDNPSYANGIQYEDKRLAFVRANHTSSTWPSITSENNIDVDSASLTRFEISTSETTNSIYLLTGLDNRKSGGSQKLFRHNVYFSHNKIFAYSVENSVAQKQYLGDSEVSTSYQVEIEIKDGLSTLYVYKKGESRSEGMSHSMEVDSASWGDAVRIRAYSNPRPNMPDSKVFFDQFSQVSLDNFLSTKYVYDNLGRLRFSTDGEGHTTESIYDNVGNLIETRRYENQVDLDGNAFNANQTYQSTKYAYDKSNRLISTTDALDNTESYTYDANGNRTSLTNKKGDTWYYQYDDNNQLIKEITPEVQSYYREGAQLKTISTPLEKTFSYDYQGNVLSITDVANTDAARTTHYEYNKIGQQIRVHHPETGLFNQDKTFSETGYDAHGLAVVNKDVGGNYSYKTYTRNQQVEFEIDALGYVTGYEYNGLGQVIKTTRYSNAIVIAGRGDQAFSSSDVRSLLSIDSANDRALIFSYDKNGRQVAVLQSAEDSYFKSATTGGSAYTSAPETRYEYDAFGNLVKQSVKQNNTDWADTHYYYDDNNRRIGMLNSERYLVTMEYDAYGNTIKNTEFARQVASTVDASQLPANPAAGNAQVGADRVTFIKYDALNRQTEVSKSTSRLGVRTIGETSYDALGNVLSSTDVYGQVTTNTYDKLGRTTQVTGPERDVVNRYFNMFDDNGYSSVSPKIYYKLDVHGNVLEETQDSGQHHSMAADRKINHTYDQLGRVIRTENALGHATHFSYDVFGRVVQTNQKVSESFSGWSAGSYNYNKTVRYGYDALGQQISTTTDATVAGDSARQLTQSTVFNGFGEQIQATIKDNTSSEYELASYRYDSNGHLIASNERGIEKQFAYDLTGKVTQQKINNAQTTINQYDSLGRLTRQQLPTFTGSLSSSTLKRPEIQQEYDAWGNSLEIREKREGLSQAFTTTTFEYNQDNKVTKKIAPQVSYMDDTGAIGLISPTTQFEYNLAGQVTKQIDAKGNERTKYYDNAGNLIEEKDAFNVSTYHAYNIFGEKVATKNALGVVTTDHYDRGGQVVKSGIIRDINNISTEITLQIYGYDQLGNRSSTTRYFNRADTATDYTRYDQSGRVLKTRNGAGLEIHHQYDMLGNKVFESDGNTREADSTFSSKTWQYDIETGRLTKSTDLKGRETSYFYNSAGQLDTEVISSIVHEFGMPQEEDVELERRNYSYYDNGLLKSIVNFSDTGYMHHTGGAFGFTFHKYYGTPNHKQALSLEYDIKGNRIAEQHRSLYKPFNAADDYSFEGFEDSVFREVNFTYDALNRLTELASPQSELTNGYKTAGINSLEYAYDKNGNRRYVKSSYKEQNSSAVKFVVHYYDYDQMDRLVISKGSLLNGSIQYGEGTKLGYDALGQRVSAEYTSGDVNTYYGHRAINHEGRIGVREVRGTKYFGEIYSYNDLGQIAKIEKQTNWKDLRYAVVGSGPGSQDFANLATGDLSQKLKVNNSLSTASIGRLIPDPGDGSGVTWHDYGSSYIGEYKKQAEKYYDNQGRITLDVMFDFGVRKHHTHSYYYDDDRISLQKQWNRLAGTTVDFLKVVKDYQVADAYDSAGNMTNNKISVYKDNSTDLQYWSVYTKHYEGFSSYRESHTRGATTIPNHLPNNAVSKFDARGNILKAYNVTYRSVNPGGYYPSYTIGNYDDTRTFTHSLEGQILTRSGDEPQSYYYHNGKQIGAVSNKAETTNFDYNFQAVSRAYPASVPGSYTVNSGDTLFSVAQNVYGDRSLWYVIAEANSLSGDAKLTVGQQLKTPSMVNNIHNNSDTFKPFNAAEVIGDTSANPVYVAPPAPSEDKCGTIIKIVLVVAVTALVTAATSGAGTALLSGVLGKVGAAFAAGAVGGAVGSVAGQLVGMHLGLKEEFSWKDVAVGAVTGSIGGGLGEAGKLIKEARAVKDLANGTSWVTNAAISSTKAVVSQAARYGVNELFGDKSTFNWASLAVTAVAAPINDSISESIGGTQFGSSLLGETVSGFVTDSIGSIAQQVIAKNGKYDWAQTAANAFGMTLANGFVDAASNSREEKALKQEKAKQQELDDIEAKLKQDLARTSPDAAVPYSDPLMLPRSELPEISEPTPALFSELEVKDGDTLSQIVKDHYGNPYFLTAVMEANSIFDSSKIYAGQKLIMPSLRDVNLSELESFGRDRISWESNWKENEKFLQLWNKEDKTVVEPKPKVDGNITYFDIGGIEFEMETDITGGWAYRKNHIIAGDSERALAAAELSAKSKFGDGDGMSFLIRRKGMSSTVDDYKEYSPELKISLGYDYAGELTPIKLKDEVLSIFSAASLFDMMTEKASGLEKLIKMKESGIKKLTEMTKKGVFDELASLSGSAGLNVEINWIRSKESNSFYSIEGGVNSMLMINGKSKLAAGVKGFKSETELNLIGALVDVYLDVKTEKYDLGFIDIGGKLQLHAYGITAGIQDKYKIGKGQESWSSGWSSGVGTGWLGGRIDGGLELFPK